MKWVLTCQHCQTLQHKCYGLADRSVVGANMTRRLVKMLWLRVSHSAFLLCCAHADMTAVDSGPVAPHQVLQTVAPVKPPTQLKQVATKGKAASCPAMQPQAHKGFQAPPLKQLGLWLQPHLSLGQADRITPLCLQTLSCWVMRESGVVQLWHLVSFLASSSSFN